MNEWRVAHELWGGWAYGAYVFMCASVCIMDIHVCVWSIYVFKCAQCVYVCVEVGDQYQMPSSITSTLFFGTESLTERGGYDWLDLLVSEPQGFSCLRLSTIGITGAYHCTCFFVLFCFMRVPGILLLTGQVFHWLSYLPRQKLKPREMSQILRLSRSRDNLGLLNRACCSSWDRCSLLPCESWVLGIKTIPASVSEEISGTPRPDMVDTYLTLFPSGWEWRKTSQVFIFCSLRR